MSGVEKGNSKSHQRLHEAARWFADHQSGRELDEVTLPLWDEWCTDPENCAAYDILVNWHQQSKTFASPMRSTGEELREDLRRMIRMSSDTLRPNNGSWARARFPPIWPINRASVAAVWIAVLAMTVGLGMLLRWAWLARVDSTERVYATASGEQGEFVLEDGSSMTLGGSTSVSVKFTPENRLVILGRGEGMFRVRHERDRPFTVCAQSACATAVGTVFDVHLYSNHVRVWVQVGSVDVRLNRQPQGESSGAETYGGVIRSIPIRLRQGQEVSYDPNFGLSDPTSMDVQAAGAWTRGSMAYHRRPLSEVVEDIQRYSSRRIAIDPAAAALTYSGTVLQRRIDRWITGLPDIFPVEVIDCGNLPSLSSTPEERIGCAADREAIAIRFRVKAALR